MFRKGWLGRYDTMFVRLFLVMAISMVAVHVLGFTVIESLFPRPSPGGFMDGPPMDMGPPPYEFERRGPRDMRPPDGGIHAAPNARGLFEDPPTARSQAAASEPQPMSPRRRRPPPIGFGLWPLHPGLIVQLATILAASFVGARLLARPIQQLARSAGRLAQDVHAAPMDEAAGPVEARHASTAFNHMQERIRGQLAQQARFLAAVSHDLRTPLTRMSLRIERIEENEVRYRLRQDLAEMNGLIDATLYYLRERDGAAGPRQRVHIEALLQAIVDDCEEIGQDVRLSGHAEPMLAYPSELRRAIVNLVENAHRYGGAAQIVLTDTLERVIIDVCDNGPGIPPEEIQRVLEPFYRVESSRSRATGGVGMGLSIAADIVGRHGGELTLTNRPEGGLRVRVVLPRN